MKSKLLLFIGLMGLFMVSPGQAQIQTTSIFDSTNVFRLPVGYVRIGDENYVGLRLQPEFRLWKLGVGINIPLFFSVDDGSFRSEEFTNGSGGFRLIDYIRFGKKEVDKVYLRWGTLRNSYVGFGYLMNNYTNAASFERRKVGLSYDVRFLKYFGIEGVYSDFNGLRNLWVFRPYTRPLQKLPISILKTLEFGITFVSDGDQKAYSSTGDLVDTEFVRDGVRAFALDLGADILKTDFIKMKAYLQYARLGKNQALADSVDRFLISALVEPDSPIADGYEAASGFNLGINASMNLIANILQLDVRLERNFTQDHFLPQFFDLNYEIDKDGKLWQLANSKSQSGTYGVLSALIIKKIRIIGGLQVPDQITTESPALVQLGLSLENLIPNLVISGTYVKGELDNLGDAFTLDERSLLNARIAYQVTKRLAAGINYRWTFAEVEENGMNVFKATNYIMPYFGLNFPIGRNRN
ncbi:MAG: hypothetical protein AAFU64_02460 [Bacteroidota bacterium]